MLYHTVRAFEASSSTVMALICFSVEADGLQKWWLLYVYIIYQLFGWKNCGFFILWFCVMDDQKDMKTAVGEHSLPLPPTPKIFSTYTLPHWQTLLVYVIHLFLIFVHLCFTCSFEARLVTLHSYLILGQN